MKNKIIVQDNAITQAKYDLTSTQKNLLYMVMGQLGKNDKTGKLYHVTLRELEKKTGSQILSFRLKEDLTNILKKPILIKKEGEGYLVVNLFSSAEYIDGKGIIEIEISDKLRPYLFDLKRRFTMFQLEMAISIKSKYSKRLYEMLSQFKDLESWSIKILDLKSKLMLYDEETGEEQYNKWSAFEKFVLKVAKKEIVANTDIDFDYIPIKKGRKFDSIRFTIKRHPFQTSLEFEQGEAGEVVEKLVEKYKLRRDQAVHIIRNVKIEDIHKLLYQVQVKKPKNIGAYTATLFGVVDLKG